MKASNTNWKTDIILSNYDYDLDKCDEFIKKYLQTGDELRIKEKDCIIKTLQKQAENGKRKYSEHDLDSNDDNNDNNNNNENIYKNNEDMSNKEKNINNDNNNITNNNENKGNNMNNNNSGSDNNNEINNNNENNNNMELIEEKDEDMK